MPMGSVGLWDLAQQGRDALETVAQGGPPLDADIPPLAQSRYNRVPIQLGVSPGWGTAGGYIPEQDLIRLRKRKFGSEVYPLKDGDESWKILKHEIIHSIMDPRRRGGEWDYSDLKTRLPFNEIEIYNRGYRDPAEYGLGNWLAKIFGGLFDEPKEDKFKHPHLPQDMLVDEALAFTLSQAPKKSERHLWMRDRPQWEEVYQLVNEMAKYPSYRPALLQLMRAQPELRNWLADYKLEQQ